MGFRLASISRFEHVAFCLKPTICTGLFLYLCVIILAARRSDSFLGGICHRIRVGRADGWERFWSQLNNWKTVRDRPHVSIGSLWKYMSGLPNECIPIPTYPKQRVRKSATTYWAHRVGSSSCGDDLVLWDKTKMSSCFKNESKDVKSKRKETEWFRS